MEANPITALCIITKNSADVIDDTLRQTIDWNRDHGIDIYLYDASDDEKTEEVAKKYVDLGYDNLFYLGFSPDVQGYERMAMIINGEGLKKEYDYIWPCKSGSFVDEGCIERVIQAEKQGHDVILIDIFGNKEMDGLGAVVSPVDFYYNRGILAMSWDTMVLRFKTIGGKCLWGDKVLTELDPEYHFGLYMHVFNRLIEIPNATVMSLYNAVIYHSRLRVSGFFKKEGLITYLPIWKDRWIDANMALPKEYDPYKLSVIHDANVPWVLGDTKILKKVHEAGGLTPENLDKALENWTLVSDVSVDELKNIAYGEYDGSPEREQIRFAPSNLLSDAGKRISVIVPCYNVAERINECVDSIIKQSVGFDNIELILVDDASTDWTVNTIKEYEGKYPDNITVVLCEVNGRQGTARNIGLSYATGDYISFVDSDDEIHLQMYEVLGTIALETDADIVTFLYTTEEEAMESDYSSANLEYDCIDIENDDDRREFVLRNDLINNSCTQKLYKRSLLERCGSFYAEGVSYEEPLFTYPLRYEIDRIAITRLPLYYYHLNPEGTINKTMSDPNTIRDHLAVQASLLSFMKDKPYYDLYKDEIGLNYIHCFGYEPYSFLKSRGYEYPDTIKEQVAQMMDRDLPQWRDNPYLSEIPEAESRLLREMYG